jgi:hypothetical protein
MDTMRQIVQFEEGRADKYAERARQAEHWWVGASGLLAAIGRRYTLEPPDMTRLRELMKWEPASLRGDKEA